MKGYAFVKRFPELDDKSQRGSKPRCHLLTDGTVVEVSGRLTGLVKPHGSVVTDNWMPRGFESIDEVKLHIPNTFITSDESDKLKDWWFRIPLGSGPVWDLVSQCSVGSGTRARRGVLLVEAKAHWRELERERKGKDLTAGASDNSRRNHDRIGSAIDEANVGLRALTSNPEWELCRDECYQLANRFAWAWKLTELGVPVVLVYLGFLNANEMSDEGRPFYCATDWDKCVKVHAKSHVPEGIWEREWQTTNGASLAACVRSVDQSLTAARMSL